MRIKRLPTVAAVGVLLFATNPSPVPAQGALDGVITAVPRDTYLPDMIVVTRDGHVTYTNLDLAEHDVVARVYDNNFEPRADYIRPDGSAPWCANYFGDCPLFWSELIPGAGTSTAVLGIADTEVGKSYEFFCTIHQWMRGTLTVVA